MAIDALAVLVNKDNKVKGLDIADVDTIFSSTRKCGGEAEHHQLGAGPQGFVGGTLVGGASDLQKLIDSKTLQSLL